MTPMTSRNSSFLNPTKIHCEKCFYAVVSESLPPDQRLCSYYPPKAFMVPVKDIAGNVNLQVHACNPPVRKDGFCAFGAPMTEDNARS